VLNSSDAEALAVIRAYLDESSFNYMSYRQIPTNDSEIFPPFNHLQAGLSQCSATWRMIFTLFRQGHLAEENYIREVFPERLFDALVATGLLVERRKRTWSTPGLGLVGYHGLWLWVSLPPYYPTKHTPKQPVYLGFDSIWLTQSLPASLSGRHVLDVCAGSGIQGLVCAARGAAKVVGVEKNPEAVPIARFNAALNGFDDRVDIRESDLYSALEADERFDFFVSNPPFMPVVEGVDYPMCGDGGADGEVVMRRIFGELPPHLSSDCQGVAFCNVLGSQYAINFNSSFMASLAERHELVVRAYVDGKLPIGIYLRDGLDSNLARSCPDLTKEQRQEKALGWLETLRERGVAAEYVYSQILRFWGGAERPRVFWDSSVEPAYGQVALYNASLTDPLVGVTQAVRATA